MIPAESQPQPANLPPLAQAAGALGQQSTHSGQSGPAKEGEQQLLLASDALDAGVGGVTAASMVSSPVPEHKVFSLE
jgi:hypothetical protein